MESLSTLVLNNVLDHLTCVERLNILKRLCETTRRDVVAFIRLMLRDSVPKECRVLVERIKAVSALKTQNCEYWLTMEFDDGVYMILDGVNSDGLSCNFSVDFNNPCRRLAMVYAIKDKKIFTCEENIPDEFKSLICFLYDTDAKNDIAFDYCLLTSFNGLDLDMYKSCSDIQCSKWCRYTPQENDPDFPWIIKKDH